MRYLAPVLALALSAAALATTRYDAPTTGPAPAAATASIEALRLAGPEGLRTILAQHDRNPGSVSYADIDAVAGQHNALWSRLYWYTDLDAAKSAAAAEHKPILYLRMLGKLTDEYSCANSRFFRTVLYSNPDVSYLLRERFILVWASERPVPVITIDYGDGRTLKHTITGNSIHYVLDSEGNIVDALPGLYDPVKFAQIASSAADAASSASLESRQEYWRDAQMMLAAEWQADTTAIPATYSTLAPSSRPAPAPTATDASARAGTKDEVESPLVQAVLPAAPPAPPAHIAMGNAMSKSRVEGPLVQAVAPPAPAPATRHDALIAMNKAMTKRQAEAPLAQAVVPQPPNAANAANQAKGKTLAEGPMLKKLSPQFAIALAAETADAATWDRIAARHLDDAFLSAQSIDLIRHQNPMFTANPSVLDRTVERFQHSIADDTVRNNYKFRRQILAWLAQSPTIALETLNQRVYSELFLTPRSDPWLGLNPEDTYTALSNEGCAIH